MKTRWKKLSFVMALVVLLSVLLCACSAESNDAGEVNLLIWGDFIDPEVITMFKEETGITVHYTTMTSNEEMLVQLENENCVYDICVPSDYIIEKLANNDMLYELNKDNIPNISNIDEQFLNLDFDPGNKYSVPYMWCTVGILYNTTMVDETVDSWDILWDEKYSGKILMYDSIRDTIGITLIRLGYDLNTRNEAEVEAAKEALIEQQPLVYAYLDDNIKDRMIAGSAALGVIYSGDAMYCITENPDLAFSVPNEGSNISFDNLIIPKTAPHKENAEKFINFLCRADVAKMNTEYICYSSPNKAALELVSDELKSNETYNPPQEVIDRCTIFHDLGDFIEVYNRAWLEIKGSN